jgi:antitoxin (DNA-binding transcriptional repressor) of toxin-antitoxin stability system
MSKKTKSPVRRDEDFEELDQELEAAMRALESVNERTSEVLQRVEQGADALLEGSADMTANGEPAATEPAPEATMDAAPETSQSETTESETTDREAPAAEA